MQGHYIRCEDEVGCDVQEHYVTCEVAVIFEDNVKPWSYRQIGRRVGRKSRRNIDKCVDTWMRKIN